MESLFYCVRCMQSLSDDSLWCRLYHRILKKSFYQFRWVPLICSWRGTVWCRNVDHDSDERERLEAFEMGLEESRKDQLGEQNSQWRSSSGSARNQEYFRFTTAMQTWIHWTHFETWITIVWHHWSENVDEGVKGKEVTTHAKWHLSQNLWSYK